MMQAATHFRKWWDGAKLVAAWAKGHAGAVLAALLCVLAAASVAERDARIQRAAELGVTRREVATEVSALRQQAKAAVEESRARARVIRELEARRTTLEREASVLRARLEFLREEDRLRVRPAITPGHHKPAGSAASRPDPAEFGIRPSTFARGPERSRTGDSGFAPRLSLGALSEAERGTQDSGLEAGTGSGNVETGGSSIVTGQRSVAAQRRPDVTADSKLQIQDSSRPGAGVFNRQPSIESQQWLLSDPESPVRLRSGPRAKVEGRIPNPHSPIPDPALDACHEQSRVQDQLISNCEERTELNRAALEAAKRSALELGEALRAKDAMAARLEKQHRAELKLARGSRLRRFGRALQYVGAGVVIGLAVAR